MDAKMKTAAQSSASEEATGAKYLAELTRQMQDVVLRLEKIEYTLDSNEIYPAESESSDEEDEEEEEDNKDEDDGEEKQGVEV